MWEGRSNEVEGQYLADLHKEGALAPMMWFLIVNYQNLEGGGDA